MFLCMQVHLIPVLKGCAHVPVSILSILSLADAGERDSIHVLIIIIIMIIFKLLDSRGRGPK